MSSDDTPGRINVDMLETLTTIVDVEDLKLGDTPFEPDVGAAHQFADVYGAVGMVIVHDGEVIAGHEFVVAEQQTPRDDGRIQVIDLDGLGWSRNKAMGAVLGLRQQVELASVNDEALADLLTSIWQEDERLLEGAGWDADRLDELLADIDRGETEEEGPLPELPDEPTTQTGDVWLLGDHRLVCGDSYDEANMPKSCDVVLTDPPYGMALDTDYDKMGPAAKGQTYGYVIGDDRPFVQSDVPVPAAKEQFWFGADWYRHTTPMGGTFLAWDKRVDPDKDSVIGSMFELIWSQQRHQRILFRYPWTAYDQKHLQDDPCLHPTQKPIPMLCDILNRWSDTSAHVLDPFAGSGSTLIACENTGRVCHAIEIDPAYCDVICARFQRHTGTKPILEATGEPHDFTQGDD